MESFAGKVVLVTGGTRGIGHACADAFVKRNAQVILCGRTESIAQSVAEHLGGNCLGLACNIADPESVKQLVDRVVDQFGALHILINNAGVTADGLLARMKDEHWQQVIDTDLSGPFYLCRAAARIMLKQRFGRIINIGSVVGLRGQAGQCNYAAAKAGLIGFTKAYAREVASRNITVNLIAPGLIETDMTAAMTPTMLDAAIEAIPVGRAGRPEEVARTAVFFASERAAYITGVVLPVDGGLGI